MTRHLARMAWILAVGMGASAGSVQATPRSAATTQDWAHLAILSHAPSWVAFGDLRGYVEPCGCDPATDMGGIVRLGHALQDVRRRQTDILVLNLGQNVGKPGALEPIKAEAIRKAVAAMAPDASLPDALRAKPAPHAVLSHARRQPTGSVERRAVKGWLVFGYHHGMHGTEAFSAGLAQRWRAAVQAQPELRPLLLFRGPEAVLRSIVAQKVFPVIVAGNATDWKTPVANQEKREPGRLHVIDDVYQVPLGGQGLLLSDAKLLPSRPTTSGALFSTPGPASSPLPMDLGRQTVAAMPVRPSGGGAEPSSAGGGESSLFGFGRVVWLGPSWAPPEDSSAELDGSMRKILAVYNQQQRAREAQRAAQRRAQLAKTPFAGAQACASCHAKAMEAWKASHHAHALSTLKERGKDKDGSCVSCHVLGYHDAGGFVSEEVTPQFADVQCENCHGPAKEHAAQPWEHKPPRSDLASCTAYCHVPAHSPKFSAEEYWRAIAH